MNRRKLIYNELLRRYFRYVRKRSSLVKANRNLRRQRILTKHINRLKEQIQALKLSIKRSVVATACLAGAAIFAPNMAEAQQFKPVQINPFGLTDLPDGYSQPTFADLDNDGDLDMLSGEYYGDFYYYENTGTNMAPAFAAAQTNPFGLAATPSGYYSTPSFVDLDDDGDFDVMSVDYNTGDLIYYENTGTNMAPAFAAQVANPFSITSMGAESMSKPTFADLDDDGDLDMMIADYGNDYIFYYENTGTNIAPVFAAPVNNPFGLTMNYDWSSTTLVDIDGDMDYDLVVGDDYGDAQYYENTGTPVAPAFATEVTNPFGLSQSSDYASHWFMDLDNDGDIDCMGGGSDGSFYYWEGCAPTSSSLTITTACSYTSPSGLYTWDATGMYNDTIPNMEGCDSVISIDLTIDPLGDLTPDESMVYACNSGDAVTVNYSSSQYGFNYYLRDEANDTIVDGPILGDGSAMAFTTGGITTPMTYNVFAEKMVPSTGINFSDDNGPDESIDVGNDASVQISGSAITLEAWVYPTEWRGAVWQGNIINKEQNSPDFGYMLRCGDDGTVNFNLGNNGWNELNTPQNALVLNQWQHIAATYNGTDMTIYIDGVQVATQPATVTVSSANNNLTIGNWAGGSGRTFLGSIDEVRIWSVARTSTQIQEAMDSCLTGGETGLAVYYQMEDGTGSTTVTDITGNGNDGTLMNMDENSDWINGATVCATCEIEMTQTISASVLTIDNTVTNNANVLTVAETGAAYQWLDCDSNDDPINGETNQDYTAAANGNYSVEITLNGCVDTSDCEAVTTVSLDEFEFGSNFKVYPNPSDKIVNIDFGSVSAEWTVRVVSPEGKEIFFKEVNQQFTTLNFANYPKGIYFLEIGDGERKSHHKIVKQ